MNKTYNRPNLQTSSQGFTIIELMIATSVFSVILLIATFGVLQITRTYYKGVTAAKTQQTTRAIIDQVSQAIQFSGSDPITITSNGSSRGFCINGKRYSYELNQQVIDNSPDLTKNQNYHALIVDDQAGCTAATQALSVDSPPNCALSPAPAGCPFDELMSPNMRLANINTQLVAGTTNLWRVTVTVAFGDSDLLNLSVPTNPICKSGAGGQFCAVSSLSTTVQNRLKPL